MHEEIYNEGRIGDYKDQLTKFGNFCNRMVIGHVNIDRFKRDVFMPTTSKDGKP